MTHLGQVEFLLSRDINHEKYVFFPPLKVARQKYRNGILMAEKDVTLGGEQSVFFV